MASATEPRDVTRVRRRAPRPTLDSDCAVAAASSSTDGAGRVERIFGDHLWAFNQVSAPEGTMLPEPPRLVPMPFGLASSPLAAVSKQESQEEQRGAPATGPGSVSTTEWIGAEPTRLAHDFHE